MVAEQEQEHPQYSAVQYSTVQYSRHTSPGPQWPRWLGSAASNSAQSELPPVEKSEPQVWQRTWAPVVSSS